jgi:hypothetical protein
MKKQMRLDDPNLLEADKLYMFKAQQILLI